MQLSIRLASQPTWRVLVGLTALLGAGHVAGVAIRLRVGLGRLQLLDLNEERGLGTVFSVALLFGAAALLALMAFAARQRGGDEARDAAWWLGLAVMFVFMGADEGVGIHELLIVPVRRALHTSGVLYFAWVVPYAALVFSVGLLYVRFLLRIPRDVAVRFVIAAAIYVGGALGMELIAGRMAGSYGERSLPMEVEYLVEESLEMLGAAYFITALLRYVERGGGPLRLLADMPDGRVPRTQHD